MVGEYAMQYLIHKDVIRGFNSNIFMPRCVHVLRGIQLCVRVCVRLSMHYCYNCSAVEMKV